MYSKLLTSLIDTKSETPPRKAMEPIIAFEAGLLPKNEMKKFTEEVNALIGRYNKTDIDADKKNLLEEIQTKIKAINYKYASYHLEDSPGYRATAASLFTQIKYQYASMGQSSLIPPEVQASALAEIIANMSPDKADKLLGILIKGANANLALELKNLYPKDDPSAEAKAFITFLREHEISYLNGGNSKNFKVTRLSDNSAEVLKVDCRLNTPRSAEAHLRNKMSENFTAIAAERQVSCVDSDKNIISRTLMITDYCKGGSLYEQRANLQFMPQLEQHTGKIFEEMARILLKIQEADCMFPDAKISNWLIDEQGRLFLADTKSFLFTENGKYHSSTPGNEYSSFLSTKNFNPPENSNAMHADHIHAYLLGKNLYYYASLRAPIAHNGAEFDFSSKFFSTQTGSACKTLIEALVKKNPAERMPIKEAVETLFFLNNPAFKNVFAELKELKFGANDEKMNEFIWEKQEQIHDANPGQKREILNELVHTVEALKKDTAVQEVREVIKKHRDKVGTFTSGMESKADKMEQAMGKVPIADRSQFLASEKSRDVMKAMATHRTLGKKEIYLTKTGEIDTKKAAQSFKDFKRKFEQQMAEKKEPQQDASLEASSIKNSM